MKYLLAVVLPPVVALRYGRPRQLLVNVLLTLLGWLPGVLHACLLIANSRDDAWSRELEAIEHVWRQEEMERYRDRQRDRIAS